MKKDKQLEFIAFVKTFIGAHTYLRDVRWWLESSRKYKACETVDQLISLMKADKDFEERHIKKVKAAFKFYFDNKHLFVKKAGKK